MGLKKFMYRIVKNFKFLPKETILKVRYEYYNGKKLNLDKPIDFNEKIQWLKLYYHVPILTQLADKCAVRSYVKKKVGKEYLNELYGVYENVNEIDFSVFPSKFVLKGAHGSSTNLIVEDKNSLDISKTQKTLNNWLRHNQYKKVGFEWAYKNIPPKIICEAYLEDAQQGKLTDYKFYCFNGKPKFITVQNSSGKFFYGLNWEEVPFSWRIDYKGSIRKPSNLKEMIKLSEKLADTLPFVRVDFYSIKGKIIFGEMTFYPTDGRDPFYPKKYNKIIGDYLKLPKIPAGQKTITNY